MAIFPLYVTIWVGFVYFIFLFLASSQCLAHAGTIYVCRMELLPEVFSTQTHLNNDLQDVQQKNFTSKFANVLQS